MKRAAFAAAGAPLVAKAWEKPMPALGPSETWTEEAWENAYAPKDFIFVKPSVQLIGADKVGIFWKTKEIATGWADVSQDSGATWRKVWSSIDGIRDINTRTHLAVVEGYDMTKPLKYRAISRPIAEFGRFGHMRFAGEELDPGSLQGYYVKQKEYRQQLKTRNEKYSGEEYVEEGEIAAIRPDQFDIVMLNDVHHGLSFYPKLLDYAPKNVALTVFAGDILDHSRSEQDFDKFLDSAMAYAGRRTGCLTRFARGNHETMGLYAPFVRNHVALQDNALYGAVTVGDTRLLFLDTGNEGTDEGLNNWNDMDRHIAVERRWLDREIASPEWKGARRRIAFAHIPPDYGKLKRSARIASLYEPLAAANLTLLCAGHEHDGHFEEPGEGRPYPMVIGGGPYKERKGGANCIATVSAVSVKSSFIELVQTNLDGQEIFRRTIDMNRHSTCAASAQGGDRPPRSRTVSCV